MTLRFRRRWNGPPFPSSFLFRRSGRLLLFVLFVVLGGRAALAELYRVDLVGGRAFESRYLPIEDPESADRILLLTDAGNWIALPKRLVERVAVDVEERGFGKRLDSLTIAVGPAANDRPPAPADSAPADPLGGLSRLLAWRLEALTASSVEQFVEPEDSAGIPLRYSAEAVPSIGSPERFVTPQDRP